MSQYEKRIVPGHVRAHRHLLHPLAALYRKRCRSFLVHYVNGTECPAVDLYSLTVLCGGIAVAVIVCVRFNYGRAAKLRLGLHELLDPFSRDNVGSVGLSCVQLDTDLSGHGTVYLFVDLFKPCRRQITGKIHHGLVSFSLCIGNISFSAFSGCFSYL